MRHSAKISGARSSRRARTRREATSASAGYPGSANGAAIAPANAHVERLIDSIRHCSTGRRRGAPLYPCSRRAGRRGPLGITAISGHVTSGPLGKLLIASRDLKQNTLGVGVGHALSDQTRFGRALTPMG